MLYTVILYAPDYIAERKSNTWEAAAMCHEEGDTPAKAARNARERMGDEWDCDPADTAVLALLPGHHNDLSAQVEEG